jgi:hypothetical protein
MATGRVPVHIFAFDLIALKSHRVDKVNRSMYMSTRDGSTARHFQQTAELYRRFPKSADRVGPSGPYL